MCSKIEYCTSPVFKTSNGFIPVALPDKETVRRILTFPGKGSSANWTKRQYVSRMWSEKTISRINAGEDSFDTLTEYLVLSITFTLLQWQQVRIPGYFPNNPHSQI